MPMNVNTMINTQLGCGPLISNASYGYAASFKSERADIFENSTSTDKKKSKKTNIALATVLGIGLLIGIDFAVNHGKVSRSIWNKVRPTEQQPKTYVDNIEQVQQHFSKIFGKNFSKDEANELAKKYQDIMNIDTGTKEGSTKFIGKLYQQVMTDFGFNTSKLTFKLEYNDKPIYACMSNSNDYLKIYCLDKNSQIMTNLSKGHYMESLCHELTHAKQHNLACAANKDLYLEVLIERFKRTEGWATKLAEHHNNATNAYNDVKSQYLEAINKGLCSDVTTILSTHSDYNKGLRYIESMRNYKSYPDEATLNEYKAQLVEKEAYEVGDSIQELLDFLKIK